MIGNSSFITVTLTISALMVCGATAMNLLRRRKSDREAEKEVRKAVADILQQPSEQQEVTTKNLRRHPTDSELKKPINASSSTTPNAPEIAPNRPEPELGSSAPSTCNKIPLSNLTKEENVLSSTRLRPIADSVENEDLRLLLLDRLDEMDDETEIIKQALCAVDVYDEITQMKTAYSGTDAEQLKQFLVTIRLILSEQQCDILCSDSWEPETQKIGRTDYDLPEGEAPTMTANLSSGLRVNGRIIRKQSIALSRSLSEH